MIYSEVEARVKKGLEDTTENIGMLSLSRLSEGWVAFVHTLLLNVNVLHWQDGLSIIPLFTAIMLDNKFILYYECHSSERTLNNVVHEAKLGINRIL